VQINFYYRRRTGKHLFFHSLPYIVASRSSEELIKNLLHDDAPVLFEGLHCCFCLGDVRLKNRKKIVRMHNIEHHYYAHLSLVEKNFFRRKYFEQEAKKLEKFESVLKQADAIAAISPSDATELALRYKNVTNIMAFHPHDKTEIKEGKGDFVLYHGSLAVGENNKAALYLVNEVFNEDHIPFVIAGNGASAELKNSVKNKKKYSTERKQLHRRSLFPYSQRADKCPSDISGNRNKIKIAFRFIYRKALRCQFPHGCKHGT